MRAWLIALSVALTPHTFAAPPPGHPGAREAVEMLGVPVSPDVSASALPHVGTVRTARDSNAFTFIEVEIEIGDGRGTRWIAAPLMQIAPGDKIRFDDGRLMRNFYSRKHQITFDAITFVGRAVREATPQ
jgi:hypothetical protein